VTSRQFLLTALIAVLHLLKVCPSLLRLLTVVAERGDRRELGRMLQLVLGCAVNCDDKHEYIRRIMNMEEAVQHDVMKAIQEVHCFVCFHTLRTLDSTSDF